MAKNANIVFNEKLSFSNRLALFITKIVGTMASVYAFTLLALVALPAAIQTGNPTILVNWLSSNFLQLVLLPLIMVGQDLASKHTEVRAELDFETNMKAEKEIEKILNHLEKIDKQILKLVK